MQPARSLTRGGPQSRHAAIRYCACWIAPRARRQRTIFILGQLVRFRVDPRDLDRPLSVPPSISSRDRAVDGRLDDVRVDSFGWRRPGSRL